MTLHACADGQTWLQTSCVSNHAPVITSTPPPGGVAGAEYRYPVIVTDDVGDTHTFTLVGGPDGMSIDNAGVITWTPAANQIYGPDNGYAIYGFTVYVDDHKGGLASQVDTFLGACPVGQTWMLHHGCM